MSIKIFFKWFSIVPLIASIPFSIRVLCCFFIEDIQANSLLDGESEILGISISIILLSLFELSFVDEIGKSEKYSILSVLVALLVVVVLIKALTILCNPDLNKDFNINSTKLYFAAVLTCFSGLPINLHLFAKYKMK